MNSYATEPRVYYITEVELEVIFTKFNMAALALSEYGAHAIDCGVYGRKKIKNCTCGLDAKIDELHKMGQETLRRMR